MLNVKVIEGLCGKEDLVKLPSCIRLATSILPEFRLWSYLKIHGFGQYLFFHLNGGDSQQ